MTDRRSLAQRRADAVAVLEQNGHALLATASQTGEPHVIAVSAAWTGGDLLVATRDGSATARNLDASGRARLAFGTPADLVLVYVTVVESVPANSTAGPIADAFRAAAGWNPSDEGTDWRYFRLAPVSIQAYRGYGEHQHSHVMREGQWLA
jgi:hypothetical protein